MRAGEIQAEVENLQVGAAESVRTAIQAPRGVRVEPVLPVGEVTAGAHGDAEDERLILRQHAAAQRDVDAVVPEQVDCAGQGDAAGRIL